MELFLQLSFIISVLLGFVAAWYAFKEDYMKLIVVPVAFVSGFCASVAIFVLFYAIVMTGIDLFL